MCCGMALHVSNERPFVSRQCRVEEPQPARGATQSGARLAGRGQPQHSHSQGQEQEGKMEGGGGVTANCRFVTRRIIAGVLRVRGRATRWLCGRGGGSDQSPCRNATPRHALPALPATTG